MKRCYRDPSEYYKDTLLNQANNYIKHIIEAKQNCIAKMCSKLDCPDTASKTYWLTISRFLTKKRCLQYTAPLC